MKKMTALLLVLMLLTAVSALGEGEIPSVTGDWYSDLQGIPMKLTFEEDGTYSQEFPGVPEEYAEGTWELRNGFVYLDGNDEIPMAFNESVLLGGMNLRFTREETGLYAAARQAAEEAAGRKAFTKNRITRRIRTESAQYPVDFMRAGMIL